MLICYYHGLNKDYIHVNLFMYPVIGANHVLEVKQELDRMHAT